MSRLISATILPDKNSLGETLVELTFETPLVAHKDWKSLHAALRARDIPRQTHVETRRYASPEIAERAIAVMGGKVTA